MPSRFDVLLAAFLLVVLLDLLDELVLLLQGRALGLGLGGLLRHLARVSESPAARGVGASARRARIDGTRRATEARWPNWRRRRHERARARGAGGRGRAWGRADGRAVSTWSASAERARGSRGDVEDARLGVLAAERRHPEKPSRWLSDGFWYRWRTTSENSSPKRFSVNVPSDALAVRPPQSVERGGTEARRKRALSSLRRRGGPLAERHVLRREGAHAPPVSDPAPRFQTVVGRQICFPRLHLPPRVLRPRLTPNGPPPGGDFYI